MNILMVNQPMGNRGDESAHRGLLRALCREISNVNIRVLFLDDNEDSICQINVHSPQVEYINIHSTGIFRYARRFYLRIYATNILFYIFRTFRTLRDYYMWADCVVSAPGGICMGGFQNWLHIFFLMIAKTLRKPLAYYGRSIGPFPIETKTQRLFKKRSLEIMRYISFLSLRDQKSIQIASELGFNCIPTVDAAFLDTPKADLPMEISKMIDKKDFLIFVPNNLVWHPMFKSYSYETVLRFFCSVTDMLQQKFPAFKIVMLPQLYNNTGQYKEMNFFEDIRSKCKKDEILILSDHYGSDIQQTVISKSKLVVGARYHSIVFALNNNIPFIALSYEHKIIGLLESLGIPEFACDISHAFNSNQDTQEALSGIERIINNLPKEMNSRDYANEISRDCFVKFSNYLKSLS